MPEAQMSLFWPAVLRAWLAKARRIGECACNEPLIVLLRPRRRGFLLPPTRYWVVDEAHGAEAEARRALAVKLDAAEIVRLANRLAATDAKAQPVCASGASRAHERGDDARSEFAFSTASLKKAAKAGRAFSGDAIAFSHHMKDLVACDTNRQNRNYENIELWINDEVRGSQQFAGLREYGKKFQESAEKLVAAASELVAFLEGVDGVADVQRDVATVVIDAKGHAASVRPYSE